MPVRDTEGDRAYYSRRAHEEREKAATREDNAAALAHLELAEEYARKAREPVPT